MAKRNENLKKYEATVRSRVECEEIAFQIVNNLIDGKVDGPYLIKCGKNISREHYTDVVEERAISYLCGYPLCDNALSNIPKKQYHISTSTNKVYDISERKNFCSNQCLKASKHFCNQIPESPLWARAKEAPVNIKLLPHTEISGMVGNEVVGISPQKLLEKEIKKLEELEIRSPTSKKETQPPEKKKIQTVTAKKISHAIIKNEENESLEENTKEELVDRNPPKHSVNFLEEEKPAQLDKTLQSEESVNNHDIISLNVNVNRQHEEVTLPDETDNFKSTHKQENDVIHSSNVSVNCDKRSEDRNEQTTKIDYLMKLLSKRKEVLSGMIDVVTVVSGGGSLPAEGTSPPAEGTNATSSAQETFVLTSAQPSPSENLLQASVNQVNLNQYTSQNSVAKMSTKNRKSSSKKKKSPKSPLERLGVIMKTWVTQETTAYVQSLSVDSNSEAPMSFSDPRIQRGYASLCQRLDSQQKDFEDLFNDTEDGADSSSRPSKSIPDYTALKKEFEETQLRVTEFITGRKPEIVQKKEESEEKDPVYIPPVDAYDQQQIRIKIVLDRLDKFLPDLLIPLRLSVQDVSSLVRELVYTFKFDKENIVFKPSEWILVAIFVLKMLGKKNKGIAAAFMEESAVRHFTILLQGIGATVVDLDKVSGNMSGWNCHNFQDTVVVQYPAVRVLDPSRPVRIEADMNVEEAYFIPIPQIDDAAYGVSGEKEEFCNKHNLLNSIAYINQELELLGLECLKYDGAKCTSGSVFIVNRLYDLLSLYHKTAKVKNDLEVRNHRLVCETDHQQSSVLRMKRLQEQTDRELDQEREKSRQISLKYNQVCSKLKSEKEEVKRLTAVLQSREIQHKHEHKKKEREICRLKERLHQLLADKVPDRKVGMELMSVVSRRSEEGRRATWQTGPEKQEEEMYQILIGNYEDRQQELIQENGELRDCLLSLQRQLSALLKRTADLSLTSVMNMSSHTDHSDVSEDNEHLSSTFPSITDLDEGYFQMPYDIVRHDMERMFRETCQRITNSMKAFITSYDKDHATVLPSKSSVSDPSEGDTSGGRHSNDKAEIERLKKQISNYKSVIQKQEEMIQHSLKSQSHSKDKTMHHQSQLLQEKENLSAERKVFTDEKAVFEKERKALTEAVICLSKEKQLLQDERARLIKQHLLNMRPYKNSQHRRIKDGQAGRLLPATPVYSPAKASSRMDPAELYGSEEVYKADVLSQILDQISGNVPTVQPGKQDISSATKCNDSFSQQPVIPEPDSVLGTDSPEHSTPPPSTYSVHRDCLPRAEDISNRTFQTSDTED